MSWKRSGKVEVTRKLKALHFFILSIKDFGVFFVFAPIRRDIDTRRDFAADTRPGLCPRRMNVRAKQGLCPGGRLFPQSGCQKKAVKQNKNMFPNNKQTAFLFYHFLFFFLFLPAAWTSKQMNVRAGQKKRTAPFFLI